MEVNQRLEALRVLMKENQIDMYMVPTADYHNSENVGRHFMERTYISGFTGSAGTALICLDQAGLWTDGRYFLQAEDQLKGTGVDLYKMGQDGVPSLETFIEDGLGQGGKLAFDGRCVTYGQGLVLEKIVADKKGSLVYDLDLIDQVWEDRPPISKEPIFELDVKYAGESRASKLARLRSAMEDIGVDCHIITSLDDIGWLLNIRGRDVDYFPLALSYLIVDMDKAVLYIDEEKISGEIMAGLISDGVEIRPYNAIYEDIKHIERKVLLDPDWVNYAIYGNICDKDIIIEGQNPTIMMKTVKNEIEIDNIRQAHIKDGIAHSKYLYWLKKEVASGRIGRQTEISVSNKLESLRRDQEDFICPSFAPISAFGDHGAIVHYEADGLSNKELAQGSFLLNDTGGNYIQGSTDISRTTALGQVSQEMKEDYTRVLQAHIRLARAKFLYGCSGANLDILARQPLWDSYLNYNHGTGHGVGYLANIHEPPISFRWQVGVKPATRLEEGMVITDEPGLYIGGSHGIRIENELLVRKGPKNDYGQFMYFEALTYCPIDLDPVLVDMLTEDDKAYLNDYHQKVYDLIGPGLEEEERHWLREVTRPI
ncbi:aminopeptidase P family protein [Peptostreptococcus stomatis]|uniref:aminopeptidase P family protein n=1 Tax=Peptostreptococcus stomatis TaxID=341694 RepID=UPI0039934556